VPRPPLHVDAFRRGLKEAGFVEGQNVSIEYRWAEGQSDRLPALAADLVRRHVSVIAALGGDVTALAAKAATSITPIVFMNGSDPVKSGLVTSINRPGGNVTGVSLFAGTVDAKRLELLHELVPQVSLVAVLNNPLVAETEARSKALADAAATMGLQLLFLNVSNDGEFDNIMTLATLEDVRSLVHKHLPPEYRAKFGWRQLAGPLRRAAYGEQDVAVVLDALRIVLQVESVPCR
jgi:putative tryptophan/tyrosine transport system substrate-binding protein